MAVNEATVTITAKPSPVFCFCGFCPSCAKLTKLAATTVSNCRSYRFYLCEPIGFRATAGCSFDIKSGIVKQHKPKKQPTRDDLASAWKMIRDQSEIIELQAKIHRQDHLPETEGKHRTPGQLTKSQGKRRTSPSRYVN